MREIVPEIGLLVAFGAGIVSFLSPCVAPLVPGYLSYVSGISISDLNRPKPGQATRIFLACLLFVIGFSLVFVLLGASASFFGDLLEEYRRPLNRLSGVVMILMGLFIIGIIRLPQLYQERRFEVVGRSFGPAGMILLGMAFAFGWTPCVGPILASILFYAGSTETAGQGALLLLAYSLGMGIPFILAGLGFTWAIGAFSWMRRNYQIINVISGLLLVGVGMIFVLDRFFYFNILAQRLYYTFFY